VILAVVFDRNWSVGLPPFVQQRLFVSLRYFIGGSSFLVTNLDVLYLPPASSFENSPPPACAISKTDPVMKLRPCVIHEVMVLCSLLFGSVVLGGCARGVGHGPSKVRTTILPSFALEWSLPSSYLTPST
jgi:hypothetical protein